MSTIDLAANTWSRKGSTHTDLDYWVSVRVLEPVELTADEIQSEPEPFDPERRTLPDDLWQEWFGIWR